MPVFTRHGAWPPASPVIVSVPHAGRDYSAALLACARVPPATLRLLEDRHVDTLALAAHGGETLFVQHVPRASVDLNRAEDDRDPEVDEGAAAGATRSAKVRSGLGLVPRRAGGTAMLWRRRFTAGEVAARIAAEHQPYHQALDEALGLAVALYGQAALLDLHSMPPLPGPGRARLVVGDRFGRTAPARLVARIEAEAETARLSVALNAPYAGGHLIERHASARHGRHAIQLEIDRTLYLDAALDRPGRGFASTAALVRRIVAALADEIAGDRMLDAAE
jgi:N-formylglutamate amidohydrolase